MATLLRRLRTDFERRYSVDDWIAENTKFLNSFGFNGSSYPFGVGQSWSEQRVREISGTLPGYTAALRGCPPAFAAQMVRALVLSQVRFTFRNPPWHVLTPRRMFGNLDLRILERPWKNATTGELVARMEWHAGLAGNAYVTNWQRGRLRVLRPDWVAILYGSQLEPDDPAHALDGEVIGYIYQNGGLRSDNPTEPRSLFPSEVAHWSPLPDPENAGIGMSWLTPAIREIQGDSAATEHKLRFFTNGATPNLVVKGLTAANQTEFDRLVSMMEAAHAGAGNAYRTLYLTAGADATVVGSDLKQLDFKNTQGAGETRLAVLSRVPAPLLGISEGLAGSSLNAGNFGMARRIFADTWVYPSLQDLSAALAPLVPVPDDAELWFDTTDIPLLREDAKDAAEIEAIKATTIRTLVDGGFDPKSAVAAVQGQDMGLLSHSGLVSVQLLPPGEQPAPDAAPAA